MIESHLLLLLKNLHNAALEHKKLCTLPCSVSLHFLKALAVRAAKDLSPAEKAEFSTWEWPF